MLSGLPDNLKERLPSLVAHAALGANAAIRGGQHPLAGVPAALLLEGLAHSPLANSLGGSAAIVAGYAPLAVASMDLSPLIDWLKGVTKAKAQLLSEIDTTLTPTKTVYDVETGAPTTYELTRWEGGWTYERQDGYVPPPQPEPLTPTQALEIFRRPLSKELRQMLGE